MNEAEHEALRAEHAIFERSLFGREVVDFDELLDIYGEGVNP